MKTIAVWVAKGGTGKSSTTGNLVYELRKRGRVLAIDADPRATFHHGYTQNNSSMSQPTLLTGAMQLADAILSVREGLDLLPTFAIGGGLKEWAETKLYGKPQAFTRLIRDISGLGYEYTVFDMSPGASLLERSIVAAVDEALPILRPEIFSVDGLEVFVETLNEIRNDLGGRVASSRLVVNGLNRSMPVHLSYADSLTGKGGKFCIIPQSARITNAQTDHVFLAEYAPADKPLNEYARLAEAVG